MGANPIGVVTMLQKPVTAWRQSAKQFRLKSTGDSSIHGDFYPLDAIKGTQGCSDNTDGIGQIIGIRYEFFGQIHMAGAIVSGNKILI